MKEGLNFKHFPPSATHCGKRSNSLKYALVFACMPLCLKHVICHAKFNCPVGVVAAAVVIVAAAVAEAAIAVAVALVVAVVEVLVLHALYNLE